MTIIPARYTGFRWQEANMRETLVTNLFTWSDKAGYVSWRDQWKAELKQNIKEIRRLKEIRRDHSQGIIVQGEAQSGRQALRVECFNMFLLRTWSKQLAKKDREDRLAAEERNRVA